MRWIALAALLGGCAGSDDPVPARPDAMPLTVEEFCAQACGLAMLCFDDSSGTFANDPAVCEPECATDLAACTPGTLGIAADCFRIPNACNFPECLLGPTGPLIDCHEG